MSVKIKRSDTQERIISKLFYSAGTACAKIRKSTKKIDWPKVSDTVKNGTKSIGENIAVAARDLKETAGTIKDSFLAGFEETDTKAGKAKKRAGGGGVRLAAKIQKPVRKQPKEMTVKHEPADISQVSENKSGGESSDKETGQPGKESHKARDISEKGGPKENEKTGR